MQYYDLSSEELEMLQDFQSGSFVSGDDDLTQYQQYAEKQLQKNKNINIRLSFSDLWKLKVKALEEGIPYQTLAASMIHKGLRLG